MAKYTITIKSLLDNNYNLGLDTYPIFDENYRDVLNSQIQNHFYENEIGFETAALFKFFLNQRMNEIMPKYNELYTIQRQMLADGSLTQNVNYQEQTTRTIEGHASGAGNNTGNISNTETGNNKNLFQDTPGGKLKSLDLENQEYATNLTLDSSSNTTTGTTSAQNSFYNDNHTTDGYVRQVSGSHGLHYGIDILTKMINNFVNIDMLVIKDLEELFMQIY